MRIALRYVTPHIATHVATVAAMRLNALNYIKCNYDDVHVQHAVPAYDVACFVLRLPSVRAFQFRLTELHTCAHA